jgi:YjbE family integral membrane protein
MDKQLKKMYNYFLCKWYLLPYTDAKKRKFYIQEEGNLEGAMIFILSALKITLLDLTLSGDNVGVIALATRNLPEKLAKKASYLGIAAAVALSIIFASCVTSIMSLEWLHIKLIGGLILAKITWDFVAGGGEEEAGSAKASSKFWEAVAIIVVADISMRLDNVLAIAAAANGHIGLLVFGVALNIPILIFGSQFVGELMKKFKIVIYAGGAVLAHTSLAMIFEDKLVSPYVPHLAAEALPFLAAGAVMAYGWTALKRSQGQGSQELTESLVEERAI